MTGTQSPEPNRLEKHGVKERGVLLLSLSWKGHLNDIPNLPMTYFFRIVPRVVCYIRGLFKINNIQEE